MEPAKHLSVQVAAWSRNAGFMEMLSTLDQQTCQDFQLTVVDNAPADGLTEWLHGARPDVLALRNLRPLSWSRSHNQALALNLLRCPPEERANRLIVLLRHDTLLSPDALARLAQAFAQDPELALAGPTVRSATVVEQFENEVRDISFGDKIENCGLAMTKGRRAKPLVQEGKVFAFGPACLAIRVSALDALKSGEEWLDEDLGEAAALLDLAWRAHWLGLKVGLAQGAAVWRLPHGKDKLTMGEWFKLLFKNETWGTYVPHDPWIKLEFWRRWLSFGQKRPKYEPRPWTGWSKIGKKRQILRRAASVTSGQARRWFA